MDGHVQALVDDLGCDWAAGLGEGAQAFGTFLNELTVVDLELVEQHWDKLVDVMHNLSLPLNVLDLVKREKDAKLLLILASL